MFLLPKGTPLFENMAVTRLKLPEIMSKLNIGCFTGYASFVFRASIVILVFETGKLVSALHEEDNGRKQNGFEALSTLAELMVTSGSGAMNVYKLSKDLTISIHALLEGDTLYKAQELKLIDINSLLKRIKDNSINGCLRIYTAERSAMIFYKEGSPLGFFHDGSSEIETSSSESQKIAMLPGAKIDLFSTRSAEEIISVDLLEVVNIQKVWETTVALYQTEINRNHKERQEKDRKIMSLKLAELEEQVKLIAKEYVGKIGVGMVDKEMSDNGGNSCMIDEVGSVKFLAGIERTAKLLISGTNIKAMTDKISAAIAAAKSGF